MHRKILTVACMALTLLTYQSRAEAKCFTSRSKPSLDDKAIGEITIKITMRMVKEKITYRDIVCYLGKPDLDVVFSQPRSATIYLEIKAGDRYLAYGEKKTANPENKYALELLIGKDGNLRQIHRIPEPKRNSANSP